MEITKKRKADENGSIASSPPQNTALSPEDIRRLIEPFSKEQLLEIVQAAAIQYADVLESVRTLADSDVSLRKLFIRGLSFKTTSETLRNIFCEYGELEEATVIFDKNSGQSKGFGFITYKHADGALMALKEPSKNIDGRMTVTQLASAGMKNSGNSGGNSVKNSDVSSRKIYVGNVPYEIPSERLLGFFSSFGEVEEGPLGFDKSTGKSKGFAFFIYKNEDGARAAIAESTKFIDGHQVVCKMAVDNSKKAKSGSYHGSGDNTQQQQQPAVQQPLPNQYSGGGVPSNMPQYSGYNNNAYGMNSSVPVGGSGGGGYGGSGPYGGSYGGGPSGGDFGGLNNAGNSMYRMNPGPGGMPPAGYSDGGAYGLSQPHQPSSLPPRVPPGGSVMYQGMPPYY